MTDKRTLEDVVAVISTRAAQELQTSDHYLLSKLGKDLGEDVNLIKDSGYTLGSFIKDRFSEYDIVLTGKFENVQALVKKQISSQVIKAVTAVNTAPSNNVRFHPRFWAAFAVPHTADTRYINMDDFSFVDQPNIPSAGKYLKVEPKYIVEANLDNRDKAILSKIYEWLADNGLGADQFVAKKRLRGMGGTGALSSQTLMHAMLDALDKRQLASVSLPLDVVATLLGHRK
jgi:hypothetical protein